MTKQQLIDAKMEAKKLFVPYQCVTGVGIGNDCIHIYVEKENDAINFPTSIKGVPVKTIVTGKIVAQ